MIKGTLQRKINKFYSNKLNVCKKCHYKGVLSKNGNQWHVLCLGKCTNHTELHKTRLGAIKEWNS